MNLIKAELSRLASRRFAQVTLGLVVLVLLAIAAGMFVGNQKIDASARVSAQHQADQAHARDLQECQDHPERFSQKGPDQPGDTGPAAVEQCVAMMNQHPPEASWFMPSTFAFKEYAPPLVMVLGGLLALYAFLVGATYIGAEWSTGGLMNLLLWRPRRAPTLLGKLVAFLAWMTALFVVLGALWAGALYLLAALRGDFDGVTTGFVYSTLLTALRSFALVLTVGTLGFAVASLGRRTAAALGAAIGVFLVGVVGSGIVLNLFQVERAQRFQVEFYILAWLNKGMTFDDFAACAHASGACTPPTWEITMNQSALFLGVTLVVALGAAFWSFSKRDIT